MRIRRLLLLLLVLLCSCAANQQKAKELPETIDSFSEAMRWKDFKGAASYVNPELRDRFLQVFAGDKDLHITDSAIQSVDIHSDVTQADAIYVMEYYHLPSPQIKEWRWEQQWMATPEAGRWLIMNPPPAFPWQQ